MLAALTEIGIMFHARAITLADLLMLFIYLEVLAMVAVYLESHSLPVRLPMYIAIVALAHYLILDIKTMDDMRVLVVASVTLLIAFAVLTLRFAETRYPESATNVNRDQIK